MEDGVERGWRDRRRQQAAAWRSAREDEVNFPRYMRSTTTRQHHLAEFESSAKFRGEALHRVSLESAPDAFYVAHAAPIEQDAGWQGAEMEFSGIGERSRNYWVREGAPKEGLGTGWTLEEEEEPPQPLQLMPSIAGNES